jgi:hypothetical protein
VVPSREGGLGTRSVEEGGPAEHRDGAVTRRLDGESVASPVPANVEHTSGDEGEESAGHAAKAYASHAFHSWLLV